MTIRRWLAAPSGEPIRGVVAVLCLMLLATSCSSTDAPPAAAVPTSEPDTAEGTIDSGGAEPGPDSEAENRCVETTASTPVTADRIDLTERPLDLVSATVDCATAAVIVATQDGSGATVAEAAELALAVDAPMFVVDVGSNDPALAGELDRLRPRVVHLYGDVAVEVIPSAAEVRRVQTSTSANPEQTAADTLRRIGAPTRLADVSTMYVVEPDSAADALRLLPAVAISGATIVPFDRASPNDVDRVATFDGEVRTLGSADPTWQWRVDLAVAGTELPGGGTDVFPGRRLVALYGSPVTSRLGVLGEQDVEESFARLQPLVAEYSTDDSTVVVPSFEIIVTVADGVAGRDGDYSAELAIDKVEPWVDYAAEHGVFVVLDLQPGRATFLEQAMQYESLLRQPHVGLALDPEWRLGPSEQPLQRIGSVGAAEVNAVIEWLAEIVREDALPQKLLVVHQFLRRMVPDRELIATPEEVALVIHVDGQGSLATKRRTYTSITTDAIGPDQTLWWGWKNFYDEDSPVARADQVDEADPWPVVITFQ